LDFGVPVSMMEPNHPVFDDANRLWWQFVVALADGLVGQVDVAPSQSRDLTAAQPVQGERVHKCLSRHSWSRMWNISAAGQRAELLRITGYPKRDPAPRGQSRAVEIRTVAGPSRHLQCVLLLARPRGVPAAVPKARLMAHQHLAGAEGVSVGASDWWSGDPGSGPALSMPEFAASVGREAPIVRAMLSSTTPKYE
jgi:hypothetical protein